MTDRAIQINETSFWLRCVALPILARDIGDTLEAVFSLWNDPRFFPAAKQIGPRPVLLVVVNNADTAQLAKVRNIFGRFPHLTRCFSSLQVVSADLTGDYDLYVHDVATAMGAFGNKAGPNFLFQRTMEFAAEYGGFTLQIELDCLPVEAGWLDATEAVVAANAYSWVIGSIYAGHQGLARAIQTHLNGNAIYATGEPAFQSFLRDIWIADLIEQAQNWPNLAYDCWWAVQQSTADAKLGNAAWRRVQTYESFFRNYPFIVNLRVKKQGLQDFLTVFDHFDVLGRRPIFFHGGAMIPVLHQILAEPSLSIAEAIDQLTPPAIRVSRRGFARVDPKNLPETWIDPAQPPLAMPDNGNALTSITAYSATGDTLSLTQAQRAARILLVAEAGRLLRDEPPGVLPEDLEAAIALSGHDASVVRHFLQVRDHCETSILANKQSIASTA